MEIARESERSKRRYQVQGVQFAEDASLTSPNPISKLMGFRWSLGRLGAIAIRKDAHDTANRLDDGAQREKNTE